MCAYLSRDLCLDDNVMQETLLNLLLRNYLHYNLYDQAEKLRSKAPRFEAHSNQQVFFLSLFFFFFPCSVASSCKSRHLDGGMV